METVSLSVEDLYNTRALILGHQVVGKDGKPVIILHGFVNERGISEGLKRALYQIGKTLTDQVELINAQRKQIASYTEPGVEEDTALNSIRKQKEEELFKEEIKVVVDKIDFARVENLTLNENYQLLYDKFFK